MSIGAEHGTPVALSLSELVRRTGVPASTIHHYLRSGLIPPPNRCAPNRFSYDERHVSALRLIRVLRERQGLGLDEIAERLPGLLAGSETGLSLVDPDGEPDVAGRLVACAIEAFQTRSYGEVTVADIAEAADVAKGSVYRHFASKEELFTAAVEKVLADTATEFADAVRRLGGPDGVAGRPVDTTIEFARIVAQAMPMLLELGSRAAKGHVPSEELARRVLRTLAAAVGRPLTTGDAGAPGDPIKAGLAVIHSAFSVLLDWAVGTDWPPDEMAPTE